ncbi:uncharacterized protein [Miscanthus floridulus]|uniref:uncharacterized protein n=1 Tax=Miscanthus floridulus TaxID=154761 RepID=UPI0034590FDE
MASLLRSRGNVNKHWRFSFHKPVAVSAASSLPNSEPASAAPALPNPAVSVAPALPNTAVSVAVVLPSGLATSGSTSLPILQPRASSSSSVLPSHKQRHRAPQSPAASGATALAPSLVPSRERHRCRLASSTAGAVDPVSLSSKGDKVCTKESLHGQSCAESTLSVQELQDSLTGKPQQCHPSEVAAPHTAPTPRGRYARSKVGWASKEGSTHEGYNWEEHSWQFESPFPQGMSASSIMDAYEDAFPAPAIVRSPKKKSPEERKAIKEKKIVQSERASVHHVETALSKYNRANNTAFELDEITVKCLFFEFGGPCYHYNFTAKPEKHHSAT